LIRGEARFDEGADQIGEVSSIVAMEACRERKRSEVVGNLGLGDLGDPNQ